MMRSLSLAGAAFVALAVADPASAATPPSFDDIVAGGVRLDPSGHEMLAIFQPSDVARGMTLADAAAYGGFDHFNWVQYATRYPGHFPVPFQDPPPGGFGLQKADSLPYYWDEVSEPGLEERFNLSANQNVFGATFSDLPGDFFVIPGLTYMSFTTALVGVYHPIGYSGSDENLWTPLYVFSWNSDWNHFTGEVSLITVTRNLDDSSDGEGGVFDTQPLSIDEVPEDIVDQWLQAGAILPSSAVPEPPAWALAIGGFGIVGGVLRHRRRREAVVA